MGAFFGGLIMKAKSKNPLSTYKHCDEMKSRHVYIVVFYFCLNVKYTIHFNGFNWVIQFFEYEQLSTVIK